MTDYLLFHLYGPMVAWGDVAVGEFRPSQDHPTRTAVLGLVAAALGIRRKEEAALLALDRDCRIAVRLDSPGELLRDYHTTQVPPEQRKVYFSDRRDELNSDKLHTILSQRDYRTDAAATIALSLRPDSSRKLDEFEQALRRPALPLYLGRKSCPLALPMGPRVVTAESLAEAFRAYPGWFDQLEAVVGKQRPWIQHIPRPDTIRFYWEAEEPSPGMQPEMRYPRRDRLLSRERWQFDVRQECYSAQSVKKEAR